MQNTYSTIWEHYILFLLFFFFSRFAYILNRHMNNTWKFAVNSPIICNLYKFGVIINGLTTYWIYEYSKPYWMCWNGVLCEAIVLEMSYVYFINEESIFEVKYVFLLLSIIFLFCYFFSCFVFMCVFFFFILLNLARMIFLLVFYSVWSS